MSKVFEIERRILELDPGTFQKLCDSYLYRKGYNNIVSLGGQAGTRKTTKGTPDTYFVLDNGKYVFVEYTTQRTELIKKINSDISSCLDVNKTEIPLKNIAEIICCHTSSNIKPKDFEKLKVKCNSHGIKLKLIGINKLSHDINNLYPILARDFLGITIDTNQIMELEEFIKDYNSNKLSAPIDTPFLFREEEIKEMSNAFEKNDVVILNGVAGAGKTRLASYYANNYSKKTNSRLYCITNKNLPIYEDLKLFLNKPGKYIILIDDANELSTLEHIIRYTLKKQDGYEVKIIITVRDYAIKSVIKKIKEIVEYQIIEINLLENKEIKEMLAENLGIKNFFYQDRIARIAQGNARIAMLAGKIVLEEKQPKSIDDLSQLYDNYYGNFLDEIEKSLGKKALITMGVIAFIKSIHLEDFDFLEEIFLGVDINKNDFLDDIYKLHELEVLDIYSDKVVKFSDQCFANYILKYVFYDKRLLDFSSMVETCFDTNESSTIYSINTLLNIFRNNELQAFITKEIKKILLSYKDKDEEIYFYLLKSFYAVDPLGTLIYLKQKIKQEEPVNIPILEENVKVSETSQQVHDEIIKILGGFYNLYEIDDGLELFFIYYEKRPDLFLEFFNAIDTYYSVKKYSHLNDYIVQVTLVEKFIAHSNNWENHNMIVLFLEISKKLLKLNFEVSEHEEGNNFSLYKVSVILQDGSRKYRGLIWNSLLEIGKKEKHKEKIREILLGYGSGYGDFNKEVMLFDLEYINNIFINLFPCINLKNTILASKIINVFDEKALNKDYVFNRYLDCESFEIYKKLKGYECSQYESYEEFDSDRRKSINSLIKIKDIETLEKIIDVCSECKDLPEEELWLMAEGLDIIFDCIKYDKSLYIKTINYYLDKNTPLNIYPENIINYLFEILDDRGVYSLINDKNFSQKNLWMFLYYSNIPKHIIKDKHLKGLYKFLADDSDKSINQSSSRDISFLRKYSDFDDDVFIKSCELILSKRNYSKFMVNIYFSIFFNTYNNNAGFIVEQFLKDRDLLIEIYFEMLSINTCFDDRGEILREIYLVKENILDKYIKFIEKSNNSLLYEHSSRLNCFFKLDNYIDIYNKIIKKSIEKSKFISLNKIEFMESIFLSKKNTIEIDEKRDIFIKQFIENNSENIEYMYYIFNVISKMKIESRIDYFKVFLHFNKDIDCFRQIPLLPRSHSYIGSIIYLYENWIEYLNQLLSLFNGLDWLEHRKYIEQKIELYREKIKEEELYEILSN